MFDQNQILAGNVLLNSYTIDWEEFLVQLADDWKLTVSEEDIVEVTEFTLQFKLGDVLAACMLVPAPKDGATEAAGNNYIWENAKAEVAKHVAHVEVGIMDCENPLQRHVLYTMVASSMMKQDNVIGLYRYPTVHRADDFIGGAQCLTKDEFPVSLWVYIGYYRSADGLWNAYTYGLEQFNRKEMEIVHSESGMYEIYLLLVQLVTWLISEGETLEDGISISPDGVHSYQVTLSEAVAFDGETLKIGF